MMEIVLIGARKYDFVDSQGREIKGVTLFHLANATPEKLEVGQVPSKVSLPVEAWGQVTSLKFPCKVQLQIEQVLTSKGVVSKVVGVVPK